MSDRVRGKEQLIKEIANIVENKDIDSAKDFFLNLSAEECNILLEALDKLNLFIKARLCLIRLDECNSLAEMTNVVRDFFILNGK